MNSDRKSQKEREASSGLARAASGGPVPTIAGPTGVGKTERSLALAERLGAEIISADSRQVYRGLDVGTAKPPAEARRRVRHHFIDEKDLDEDFSAGQFAQAAHARIDRIRERGHEALVVGGSTLYLHALHVGLADIPDVPDAVRARLNRRLEDEGADALFAELQDADPDRARKLDATKTEQVVRALEVYHHTGRTLTHYHQHQPEPPHDFRTVVLRRDREVLYDRINRRVDRMLAQGLVEEGRALRRREAAPRQRPPLRTIGYREVFDHLDGQIDRAEMERLIKRNTRRYAKRQLTWFRRYESYRWHPADAPAETLMQDLRRSA